jgi:hypothetical protein
MAYLTMSGVVDHSVLRQEFSLKSFKDKEGKKGMGGGYTDHGRQLNHSQ